jgi:hypothetical protein
MTTLPLHRIWASFYFTTIIYDDDGLDMTRTDGQPHNLDDKGFLSTLPAVLDDWPKLREDAIEFGHLMEQVMTEEEWPEGSYRKETGDLEPSGTECRIWCRTFRALKYPKQLPGYISFNSMDWRAIALAVGLFEKHSTV